MGQYIVDFDLSDGLTPQQVEKLNYNFRLLASGASAQTQKNVEINQNALNASFGAEQAKKSADEAYTYAGEAYNAAGRANTAAQNAQTSADNAATAASNAQSSANAAAAAASVADGKAVAAGNAAASAQAEAASANRYALAAGDRLSDVENVVGTLNWIAEHGEYVNQAGQEFDSSKIYYTRSGSSPDYIYTIVPQPVAEDIDSYYVLEIDESVQNFLASHIWMDNYGLNLSVDSASQSAWRIHQGTVDGTHDLGFYIIDSNGAYALSIGATGISFDSNRGFVIGDTSPGSTDYIAFIPNQGIIIGGSVSIGSGKTISQILTSLDVSVQQTASGAEITVNGDTVSIANGADGASGSVVLGITTAPSSYTTQVSGFTPKYRIALSTVKTQSGASEVHVGDVLYYSYYQYPVGFVDSNYVYTGTRKSVRGAAGAAGADAVSMSVTSTNGTVFKSNSGVSTTLEVRIFTGSSVIEDSTALAEKFGQEAYLQWKWKDSGASEFTTLLVDDPRISRDGFSLTVSPTDISTQAVIDCELIY